MTKTQKAQALQMLYSWLRVFAASSLACWMSGVTDPSALLNAGLASVVPVIIRYLNRSDPAFGRTL
jgi:hypothetical protein